MSKKLTLEEFISRSVAVHGDKYDYSKVEYKTVHDKVCIICPEHGEFYQSVNNHMREYGCKECAKSKQGPGAEDLTNKVFGRLKAVKRVDDHVLPSGQYQRMWLCECECGNKIVVRAAHLKNLSVQSCGCLKAELASERFFNDLSGQCFGKIEVLHRVDDYTSDSGRKRTRYLCRCKSCGVEKEINGESLVSGSTVSFGNPGCRENRTKIDMTGKRVGKLKVLYEAKGYGIGTHWVCECRCGRKTVTSYNNLRNESSRSCGCMNRSHLEDDVFNYLYDHNYVEWFEYIDDIPDCDDFFVSQKKFDGLVGTSGWQLKFDFVIYKNHELYCLIECQGRQHYEVVDYFGGNNQYDVQCENDCIKKDYCSSNGIKLIEISYKERTYEKVCEFLDNVLD